MLKRLSIRQLLLLAFLLVGLLPAMLVSFLSFYQARVALKKEISHDLQTLAGTVAIDINRMMFERIQNVHSWSQLAIMQDLQIGDVDKRLSIFLRQSQTSYHREYKALHVIDTHGVVVASSDASQIGKPLAKPKAWFSVKVETKIVAISSIQNETMRIQQAIADSNNGQEIGFLVTEFNWSVIYKLLSDSVKPPAEAALLAENNQVLSSTQYWNESGHVLKVSQALDGKMQLPHWRIELKKLHTVAVAPVHRLAYMFLALLAVTIILSALLVRPIAQAIVQPLEQLTDFVRGFQQQQKRSPPKSGPPELQELSGAFEHMIQDLEKSQIKLKQAAKLAVVGEMAAAMSHEVRTPLGILRSSADVLLREPKLTADGREVLGFVISETERLNKLVSNLIDAARPRAPNFNQVDLGALLTHVIAILRPQAQAKDINMSYQPVQTIEVWADKDQLIQVLMNLLINAIQILPNGGHIALLLEADTIYAKLKVADNGLGVAPENQAQMFEPFFTQRAGGVGLGLAVVKQIIQAHHGDISYQTSEYGGAQFNILLPLKQL